MDDQKYSGFSELLFSKNQHMTKYSGTFSERYVEEQQKLELDAFNILYVVLTRAVEGLYIITEKDLDKNGNHKTSYYSGLFIHYLIERGLWSVEKDMYSFGSLNEHPIIEKAESAQEAVEFMLSNKHTTAPKMVIRNATLWDDQRMLAIERGTLIHYVLGLIETQSDMDRVEKQIRAEGRLVESEAKTLFKLISRIINHPDLEPYFLEGAIIKNEQEIIDKNGLILRPDRLVIENNKVTIIDYKSGLPQPQHQDQVIKYGEALVEMGFELENRIIVYIEKDVKVEFIK